MSINPPQPAPNPPNPPLRATEEAVCDLALPQTLSATPFSSIGGTPPVPLSPLLSASIPPSRARLSTHEGCPQPRPDWVPEDANASYATWVVQGVRRSGLVRPPSQPLRRTLTVDEYFDGVRGRDLSILGRAITLVESNAPAHREQAQELITRLLPHTGGAHRIGITGIPGAGKSTFIEALGCHLTDLGKRLAVLAIDPSSSVTGGSILADKLRMEKLSQRADAFIRPSPSGGSLGGVARKTREAILVCEAAAFDVVIVETVGVGQNEIAVRSMVDFFLLLMIAGAGDEMQGIKKGVIELADAIVINKADGENRLRAMGAQAEMNRVLHYLRRATEGWQTPSVLASALTGEGVPEVWIVAESYFKTANASGQLAARRRVQSIEWMHALIGESLRAHFYASPAVRARLSAVENAVSSGRMPVVAAAMELLGLL